MRHQECPFCSTIIVPYTIMENIVIDEDFSIHVSDVMEGEFDIFRQGKTTIKLLGCPGCKKTFIETKEG